MDKTVKSNIFPLFIADAFSKHPFSGNSAAVCLMPFNKKIENETKQKIAAEMNLSETAFVQLTEETDLFETGQHFDLEWYTPVKPVPLCGHATLATAAVLFQACENQCEELTFQTVSGVLKAKKLKDGKIQIDLPAYESINVHGMYEKVIKAVVGDLPVSDVVLSKSNKLCIRLCDNVTRKQLEDIKTVDSELLSAVADLAGVAVTLKGGRDDSRDDRGLHYDFISRYFSPWMGISEDPVTGSAHSVLAPFWSKILGKDTFYARQCSKRGGEMNVHLLHDRVLLSGNAVVVVKGQIEF